MKYVYYAAITQDDEILDILRVVEETGYYEYYTTSYYDKEKWKPGAARVESFPNFNLKKQLALQEGIRIIPIDDNFDVKKFKTRSISIVSILDVINQIKALSSNLGKEIM